MEAVAQVLFLFGNIDVTKEYWFQHKTALRIHWIKLRKSCVWSLTYRKILDTCSVSVPTESKIDVLKLHQVRVASQCPTKRVERASADAIQYRRFLLTGGQHET